MGLRETIQRLRLAGAYIADALAYGSASAMNRIAMRLKAHNGSPCPQQIVEDWARTTAALGSSRTLHFDAKPLLVRLEDGGVLFAEEIRVTPAAGGEADLQIEGVAPEPDVIQALYDVATADAVDGPPKVVDLNGDGGGS